MYRALYRKWRPKRFEDVVGQRGIVTALRNQIATGRVGHAYLFTGVRGTGKTTLCQDLCQGGQLPAPAERRPLRRMRDLQGHRQRQHSGCGGDGRRIQQRRGRYPRPAG